MRGACLATEHYRHVCGGRGGGGGGGVLRKLRVGVVPNPAAAAVDMHNVCVERAKGCLGRQPLAHAKKESSINIWRSFVPSAE